MDQQHGGVDISCPFHSRLHQSFKTLRVNTRLMPPQIQDTSRIPLRRSLRTAWYDPKIGVLSQSTKTLKDPNRGKNLGRIPFGVEGTICV